MGTSFIAKLPTATAAQAKQVIDAAKAVGAPAAAQAVAPAPLRAFAPGKERWAAKVGGENSADNVGKMIVDTSVRELGALPRPPELMPDTDPHDDYDNQRVPPVEDTIWRVKANVIALRLEGDNDYHVVLQDESGATMVAEVPNPDPAYVPADSPFFDDIKTARDAVNSQFQAAVSALSFVPGPSEPVIAPQPTALQAPPQAVRQLLVPQETFASSATAATQGPGLAAPGEKIDLSARTDAVFATRIDPTPATVTGVGFFDRSHGQTGNAPNILELHPVLGITFP